MPDNKNAIQIDRNGTINIQLLLFRGRVYAADGELKKTKPRLEGGGVLSRDAMIALNWFMRSRIGNDASR